MTGKILEYPFDTVKVRLQSQPDDLPLRFKGPIDCFKQTFQNEGLKGFFRGISSPLFGAAAENASLFLSYQTALTVARHVWYPGLPQADKLPMPVVLTCGAASGAFTSFILTPIELIKCKMQVQNLITYDHTSAATVVAASTTSSPSLVATAHESAYAAATRRTMHTITRRQQPPGALRLVIDVYKQSGILGFWRGQLGTLFRETGGSAAWFGSYEYVSMALRRMRSSNNSNNNATAASGSNTATESMLAGAVAGVTYNISLFPADSIKSRMQTESAMSLSINKGFWQVGKDMYRAGGITVLYRGCLMTVLRSAPSSAIIFLTYEQLKKMF
ncbi:mitochondrial carrier domain-containing protein [Lipomyces japonicus]|uniref:mitochondrial carrier domain-containing protein n=1 Tax=Lipomyces japonicus TaxID=56871 RepID=UPI0034CE8C1F